MKFGGKGTKRQCCVKRRCTSNDVRVPPQSPVLKNGKLRIKLMTCTVNNNLYYFTLLQLIYLLMSVEFPLGLLCLRMVN